MTINNKSSENNKDNMPEKAVPTKTVNTNFTPGKDTPKTANKPVKSKGCFKAAMLTGLLGVIVGAGAGVGGYWLAQEKLPLSEADSNELQSRIDGLRTDVNRQMQQQQQGLNLAFAKMQEQMQNIPNVPSITSISPAMSSDEENRIQRLEQQISALQSQNQTNLQQLQQQISNQLSTTLSQQAPKAETPDNSTISLALLQLYITQGQPFASLIEPLNMQLPQETYSVLKRYAENGFDVDFESFVTAVKQTEQKLEEEAPKEANAVKKTLNSLVRIRKADALPDNRPVIKKVQEAYETNNYSKVATETEQLVEEYGENGAPLQQWLDHFEDFRMVHHDINNILQRSANNNSSANYNQLGER